MSDELREIIDKIKKRDPGASVREYTVQLFTGVGRNIEVMTSAGKVLDFPVEKWQDNIDLVEGDRTMGGGRTPLGRDDTCVLIARYLSRAEKVLLIGQVPNAIIDGIRANMEPGKGFMRIDVDQMQRANPAAIQGNIQKLMSEQNRDGYLIFRQDKTTLRTGNSHLGNPLYSYSSLIIAIEDGEGIVLKDRHDWASQST